MKLLNLILLLFCCYTSSNISFLLCLGLKSKMKQDAITSLVIFARSQAEYQREKQLRILRNQNFTLFNNDELANLLKKRETVNIKELTESLKNSTSLHNSTFNETHKITNNRSKTRTYNNTKHPQQILNKTMEIKSYHIVRNSSNNNLRKKEFNNKKENQVKNVSISSNNSTLLKNTSNRTSLPHNTKNINNKTNFILHPSVYNKKLIML